MDDLDRYTFSDGREQLDQEFVDFRIRIVRKLDVANQA